MNFRATSSQEDKSRWRFSGRLRSLLVGAATLMALFFVHSGVHAADAAKGKEAFNTNCARCHNAALEKKGTGPALMGVSARIPGGDWKYRWVANSAKLIQEGDAYAVKIWNENNKAAMDPFPSLPKETIDDIFAWIDEYVVAAPTTPGGNTTSVDEDKALGGLWNWIRLLIFVIVVLMVNIAIQVARLRGVEFMAGINLDKLNARLMLGFYVVGSIAALWSSRAFRHYFIANNSASVHGEAIDQLFWITMVVVYTVFIVTNGFLFFFAYKYGKDGGRKAKYYPENHKLELIWTVVPAIVLAMLIIFGIKTWTSVMTPPEGPSAKVEVSGQQWGWILRYPGSDEKFGDISVKLIGGDNILGVDLSDEHVASHDDFIHDSLVIPKGMTVDLKIRSRDVLHSVYLPHFRVKMDAVPGMDTRFHFVANQTTQEFRDNLMSNPYWSQVDTVITSKVVSKGDTLQDGSIAQADVSRTDTIHKADKFDFELACTEICGRGHYSMRKVVVVMDDTDYKAWWNRASKTKIYTGAKQTTAPVNPASPMAGLKEEVAKGSNEGILK